MFAHIFRRLIAITVIAAIAVLLSAPVGAAPEDGVARADSPTLSLRDLGSTPDLAFYGQNDVETVNIPVLPGLTPTSLNVTALLPVFARSATLTVLQDDRVIARLDVPAGPPAPLSIPLPGVRVVDNAVSLLVRTYVLPLEGYCLDPTNPLRLTNVTVTYDGVEAVPTAVADFLPPILRRLTIYVDPALSMGVSDAVVQLAAAVSAHYGPQNPAITVTRLGDGPGPLAGGGQPFERRIVITEAPDTGVSLQPGADGMPTLLTNALTNQARILTSGVARYALTSKAVVGPLHTVPQLTGDHTTIRELGQPGVNSTALSPEVYVGLDQTRLGRAAHNIRVHLRGSYTPLPQSIGGRLVASVGGETIDRWPTTADGVVDRWVDVPDRLLQRYTNLLVKLDISGNTGRCGEFQPLTLTIDGESDVESKPAKPPIPAGFQSMPQSLMPRVQVGIGSDVFADTVRAVYIIVGMQRLSALPLDTAVMPLQAAIDSPNPGVLISTDGWNHPEIPLPVLAPGTIPMTMDVVDNSGQSTTLTLEPALRFGSLQTVFDGKRSLLVATSNGAPEQLDELLHWLAADRQRAANLNGVALVSVPGRDPVTVLGKQDATAPEAHAKPMVSRGGLAPACSYC